MKTSFTISSPKLRVLAVVVLAAVLFLPVSGYAQGTGSNQNQPWGLWSQKIPVGPGLSIHEVLSFHFDGTLTGTGSLLFGGVPPFGVARASSIHGVWQKTGPRTIEGTAYAYNFDSVTGIVSNYVRSRWTIEFSADFNSYTGTASLATLACPTPLTCPDPANPSAVWTPRFSGFTILGSRLN